MKDFDGIWIKVLVVIGWILVAIVLLSKLDIDGEHLEPVKASEEIAVAPEAEEDVAEKANNTITYIYTSDEPVICEDDEEYPTRDEVYCLVRTVHGEASICSILVKSQVAWCVLNRVDSKDFPNTIREVVTERKQFQGYYRECDTQYTVEEWQMCYQIIKAWKNGDDRYRSLPSNYYYMRGNGTTNYFTTKFTRSLSEAKRIAYKDNMPNFWEGEQ